MLLRFDYPLGDGKSLVAHHGHRLRRELIDYWNANPLEGSDLGVRSTKVSPDYVILFQHSWHACTSACCSYYREAHINCARRLGHFQQALKRHTALCWRKLGPFCPHHV
jgi:hypothetical protein